MGPGVFFFVTLAVATAVTLIIKRWVILARGFTQLGFFIVSEIFFLCNRGVPCGNCPLSFGICPIGTVQRLAFIPSFPFLYTVLLIAATGMLAGTLTCGWVCPVGFIQDILASLELKKIKLPRRLGRLRYFWLCIAGIAVFLELKNHSFSFRGIGIFHEYVIYAGAFILAFGLLVKRHFCRFLCPLGLLYGRLNLLSPIKVTLPRTCVDCGACAQRCITDIDPAKEINSESCVKCFSCKRVCRESE